MTIIQLSIVNDLLAEITLTPIVGESTNINGAASITVSAGGKASWNITIADSDQDAALKFTCLRGLFLGVYVAVINFTSLQSFVVAVNEVTALPDVEVTGLSGLSLPTIKFSIII